MGDGLEGRLHGNVMSSLTGCGLGIPHYCVHELVPRNLGSFIKGNVNTHILRMIFLLLLDIFALGSTPSRANLSMHEAKSVDFPAQDCVA